jgi:hypothetical protein
MSSDSSANDALAGYVAGTVRAEQLVGVVAAAYYSEHGARSRKQLQPLMEIVERAHPGIVALSAAADKPGFAVRLAERPFPKRYEAELRQAVQALLAGRGVVETPPPSPIPRPGLLNRIVAAIRRLFR